MVRIKWQHTSLLLASSSTRQNSELWFVHCRITGHTSQVTHIVMLPWSSHTSLLSLTDLHDPGDAHGSLLLLPLSKDLSYLARGRSKSLLRRREICQCHMCEIRLHFTQTTSGNFTVSFSLSSSPSLLDKGHSSNQITLKFHSITLAKLSESIEQKELVISQFLC